MGSKKVLFLIDTLDIGGIEQFLYILIPGMKERGYECEVAAIYPPYTLAPIIEKLGVRVHLLDVKNPWNVFKAISRITKLCRENKCSVINCFRFFGVPYLALSRPFIPKCLCVASFASLEFERYPQKNLFHKLKRNFRLFLIKASMDKIVGASRSVVKHYSKHLGHSNVVHIGYALPAEVFDYQPVRSREEIFKKVKLDPTRFTAVVPARLVPEKGHRYLIEAVKRMNNKPQVLFVGGGPAEADIKSKVQKAKLEKDIILQPALSQKELIPVVQAADLIIVPSVSEGFGLAIAEAMAMSRPVLASNVGGIPELIEHEVSGILVPSKEPFALAQALTLLMSDDSLRSRLGSEARRQAVEKFSLKAIADATDSLFSSALQSSTASSS